MLPSAHTDVNDEAFGLRLRRIFKKLIKKTPKTFGWFGFTQVVPYLHTTLLNWCSTPRSVLCLSGWQFAACPRVTAERLKAATSIQTLE